jgi:flagellar hook-associated protein 3
MAAPRRVKMRVTNMVPDVQYAMQQSQQALSAALQQVSTGLRVNQPSEDPSAAANMVVSLAESANVDQYTSNVSSVLPQMQTADSAVNGMETSLSSAVTLGISGANGDVSTQDKQEIVSQVESALSSVIALANTSFHGVYIFAGSASNTPPFVAASSAYASTQGSAGNPLSTTTALTAGSITTISDATTGETMTFKAAVGNTVATLSTAIANAVSAGTLSAGVSATIDADGQLAIGTNSSTAGIVVSSNDAALGSMTATAGSQVANAYAYVGNDNVNNVQVGDSMNVASSLSGSRLLTQGANVIGSLNGLITALQSGTSAQIGTATSAVSTALNYISEQRVPLDNTISQLSDQESYLGQETVTLTTQQTSLVGANIADAATNLSQAELANSAVLAAAAKVMPQTLLNYLAPG